MDRLAPDPGIDATLPAEAGRSTATLGSLGQDDRYLRGGVFASGGMGAIRSATDRVLERRVALKELRIEATSDAIARFVREAKLTAGLQHPSIVPVHDLGVDASGLPYYCMKMVEGRTLAAALAAADTYDVRIKLLSHMVAVTEAMAFAHEHGVIHRDLKPANVLVGEFGETIVIDWGLAKRLADREAARAESEAEVQPNAAALVAMADTIEPDSALTNFGAVLGTLGYMAPEQAEGRAPTRATDVYALGVMLFHLVTGRSPYTGTTLVEVLRQVAIAEVVDVQTAEPRVPADLASVVRRCLAHDPDQRYPHAGELLVDLRAFRDGRLVGAYSYSGWQLVRRWILRHRAIVGLGAVSIVAVSALGIWSRARILAERDRAVDAKVEAEAYRDAASSSLLDQLEDDRLTAALLARLGRSEFDPKDPLAALPVFVRAVEIAERLQVGPEESWGPRVYLTWILGSIGHPSASDSGMLHLVANSGPIDRVAVSHDGLRVLTVGDDQTARIWNSQTGAELEPTLDESEFAPNLAATPDGRHAISLGSEHPGARVSNIRTGADELILDGHERELSHATFSPDGSFAVTASDEGSVRIWRLTPTLLIPFELRALVPSARE